MGLPIHLCGGVLIIGYGYCARSVCILVWNVGLEMDLIFVFSDLHAVTPMASNSNKEVLSGKQLKLWCRDVLCVHEFLVVCNLSYWM